MRRFILAIVLVLAAMIAGAWVGAMPQPLQDPWHRPLNPQGGSEGVTYGQTAPSLASVGANPGQGELWVDTNGATDGGPILNVFDHVTGVWDAVLNSAALTAGTIPVFNGTELVDSTVDDDLTDVVATGGLFTAGSAVDAADSILLDGNNDTLQFEGGTADAGEIMFVAVDPATDVIVTMDNPAGGAGSGTWIELAAAFAAQDVGSALRALHIDIDSPANHLGAATTYAIDLDNDTDTAAGEEVAIHFTANWDAELHFAADQATIWWLDTGSLLIQDYGGAVDFILDDMPDHGAADATVASLELDVVMDIMDAGDTHSAAFIDVTNAVHTGGTLYGLNIDGITGAAAEETAAFIASGWDIDIHFGDATAVINWFETGDLTISDYGGQSEIIFNDIAADNDPPNPVMELDPTLSIMDAGADVQRVLWLDVDNVDHTNGTIFGIDLDLDLGDAQADEYAIYVNAQWDYDIGYQNTGDFTVRDVGGANEFILTDIAADNDPPVAVMELDPTLSIMDAGGDIQRVLHFDIDNVNHTNGFVYGIDMDLDAEDPNASEWGIVFSDTWDEMIRFAAAGIVAYSNNGVLTIRDAGAANELFLADIAADNAVPTTVMELDPTLSIMDAGGDIQRILYLDVDNVDHTNGVVYGIHVDLDTGDAQADELGLVFSDNWDEAIAFLGAVSNLEYPDNGTLLIHDINTNSRFYFRDVPAAGTANAVFEADMTLSAMDGAGDIFQGLFVDIGNANHSNGWVRGIDLDISADDPQSFEAGVWANAAWDGALVIEHQAGAPGENPPAGWVSFTVDDNADYSGAGGNDCAFVARTSAGATASMGIVVLNGVCP